MSQIKSGGTQAPLFATCAVLTNCFSSLYQCPPLKTVQQNLHYGTVWKDQIGY